MLKINVKNLNKIVKNSKNEDKYILKNINFELKSKDFLLINGKSGSGKSTLINIISIFDDMTSGEVNYFLENKDIKIENKRSKKKDLKIIRRNIKIKFQNSNLQFFKKNLLEEIKFTLKSSGFKNEDLKSKIEEKWKNLNFPESYKKSSYLKLSLGERKKFLIFLLIFLNPKIIILDEPFSGLDKKNSKFILDYLLNTLKKRDIIIIFITHNLDFIEYANKVLLLDNGEQKFFGSVQDYNEK